MYFTRGNKGNIKKENFALQRVKKDSKSHEEMKVTFSRTRHFKRRRKEKGRDS